MIRAEPASDMHGVGSTALRLHPSPLLATCLVASLALHALVFFALPGWQRAAAAPPVPVLDVVMVSREPEASPAIPRPVPPKPRAAVRQPARPPAERPIVAVQPNPAVPPVFTAPVEPWRSAETRPVPAPAAAPPAAPPADSVTPPLFNAAYLRNPPPRYPPAARRNGDEGRVMLKVLVNPDGAPARVEIDQSSGSPLLDGAALDSVRGWQFVPARRGAQNVEGWVRVPLVFRLES